MGTRQNRLTEAVLTGTRNLCFEQKKENNQDFSTENSHFYNRENLHYITLAFFRNVLKSEILYL